MMLIKNWGSSGESLSQFKVGRLVKLACVRFHFHITQLLIPSAEVGVCLACHALFAKDEEKGCGLL